jgi:pyruvate-ferredoxin/flavodoxin oxidoreductase
MDLGLRDAAINNPRGNLGLLALAQRNAFVAQTSVADPVHLGESMLQALRNKGPALIQVYAPSPGRHGFASEQTLAQAQLAVASRVLPLFRYDPRADGVFGSRITLDGNPASGDVLPPAEGKERPLTPADWALGQRRFAAQFEKLADNAPGPVTLAEWLQLDAKGRKGKTPFVTTSVATGDGDQEERYAVSPALSDMSEQCLANWQTLQELAGLVTPFTELVEQEIRAAVDAEHQAELDAQQQANDAQIREIQEKTQTEIASKIRSRLLQLASQKRD